MGFDGTVRKHTTCGPKRVHFRKPRVIEFLEFNTEWTEQLAHVLLLNAIILID